MWINTLGQCKEDFAVNSQISSHNSKIALKQIQVTVLSRLRWLYKCENASASDVQNLVFKHRRISIFQSQLVSHLWTRWSSNYFTAWACLIVLDITKTRLYNYDPLKPHFYIVKLGFTVVYIIFLISAQNIDCGYSLEPPRRGGSNKYPQSMFWAEIEKYQIFIWKFSFFGW